jgi:hypothetical protein
MRSVRGKAAGVITPAWRDLRLSTGGIDGARAEYVQRYFKMVFLAAGLLSCVAGRLRAESVSYPEKDPLFRVDVPKGWEAKYQNGAVTISAEANAVILLQYVETVHDDETAKAAIPKLANMQGEQFNMDNMRISYHCRDLEIGAFKGLMTDGRGVDKGGHDTLWQVMIFAPQPGKYYLVTSMWTNEDGEKTLADRNAILQSLKAISPSR